MKLKSVLQFLAIGLALSISAPAAFGAKGKPSPGSGRWFFVNLRGSNTLCGFAKSGQFLCFLPRAARYKQDHWAFLHQYSVTI